MLTTEDTEDTENTEGTERATPETDGKASPHIGFYSCATVPAEFARRLERERDEARAERDKMQDALNVIVGFTEGFLDGMRANRKRAELLAMARKALEGWE